MVKRFRLFNAPSMASDGVAAFWGTARYLHNTIAYILDGRAGDERWQNQFARTRGGRKCERKSSMNVINYKSVVVAKCWGSCNEGVERRKRSDGMGVNIRHTTYLNSS